MIKSKVFDVLKELSKEEIKKFVDYLNSPVFNKRKLISELFGVYKNYHPDFGDKNLTKEKVFDKIFPGKKYNDEVFRNLNSILLKHAEDFLSFLNYSRNPLTIKKHLLSEINHRNILTVYEKNFEESKKILESSVQKDVDYFFNQYELYLSKDLYNSIINKFPKEDITTSEKSLLTFFVMQLLEIQNYILYNCRILGIDNTLILKDTIVDQLIKKLPPDITQIPQIQIYYNSLKLELTNDEKYYSKLKSLLSKYGDLINKEKHYNKYQAMIDYIKRTQSMKDIKTVNELFQLRKEIIEKNLLMENTITNMFFWNLVKSGSRLKEFDWIYNFIDQYKTMLIPKYRETTTDLCLALHFFEKKEYDKSLSHAARVKYEDNFYSLEVKNLTSRIYFETDQYEVLDNYNSAYRMYLSKNRSLSKKEFNSHNSFLNFLSKLIRIKEQKKFYKLNSFISDLNKNEFVNDYWLLEKANELKKLDRQR